MLSILDSHLILDLLNNNYKHDTLTIHKIDCDSFDMEYHIRSFKVALSLYKKPLNVVIAAELEASMKPYMNMGFSKNEVTVAYRNLPTIPTTINPFLAPIPNGYSRFFVVAPRQSNSKRSRPVAEDQKHQDDTKRVKKDCDKASSVAPTSSSTAKKIL